MGRARWLPSVRYTAPNTPVRSPAETREVRLSNYAG